MRRLLWILGLALAMPALAEDAPNKSDVQSLLILEFKHEGSAAAAQEARLINDLVATAAEKTEKHKVITGSDIANVIELEVEREALGCDDTSASCLAEVAGAMGAELVLFGNVGKLGDTSVVTLNLFHSGKAQSAGRETVRAKDMGELPDAVEAAVFRLLGVENEVEPASLNLMQVAAWSTIGVGAIVAIGGYGSAAAQNNVLSLADRPGAEKEAALNAGRIALGVSVVGAAVAAVGVGLLFVPGGE